MLPSCAPYCHPDWQGTQSQRCLQGRKDPPAPRPMPSWLTSWSPMLWKLLSRALWAQYHLPGPPPTLPTPNPLQRVLLGPKPERSCVGPDLPVPTPHLWAGTSF